MDVHQRWFTTAALLLVLVGATIGCGSSAPPASKEQFKTAGDKLSEAELQRFLKLIQQLPDQRVPEFVPLEEDELYAALPADHLVHAIHDRFGRVVDPRRQGELWKRDADLLRRCQAAGWTPAEFASVIRCISYAFVRSRLLEQHSLSDLEQHARHHAQGLMEELAAGDKLPRSQMTEAAMQHREALIYRLGRAISLQELLKHLQRVPPQNVELVERFRGDLEQLLNGGNPRDPFLDPLAALQLAELEDEQSRTEDSENIEQTGFKLETSQPQPRPQRRR